MKPSKSIMFNRGDRVNTTAIVEIGRYSFGDGRSCAMLTTRQAPLTDLEFVEDVCINGITPDMLQSCVLMHDVPARFTLAKLYMGEGKLIVHAPYHSITLAKTK